jgi:hypothetical protein
MASVRGDELKEKIMSIRDTQKPFACVGNDEAGYFIINLYEISTIRVVDTPGSQHVEVTMRNGTTHDLMKVEYEENVSEFLTYVLGLCSYSGFDKNGWGSKDEEI